MFKQAGRIVWAPDGSGLVFQLLLDSDGNGELIYLDTQTMLQKTILTYLLDDFEFQEWSLDSQQIIIKLKDQTQTIEIPSD
jgi:hypothetical protein